MTTVFESKDGNVKFFPGEEGEMSVKIPTSHSALGLFSRNIAFDREVFADDFWVYKDDKKIRKWFSGLPGWKHFWEPVLDDVKHLESVYHKVKLRSDQRWSKLWEVAGVIMKTTKQTKNKWGQQCWLVHAQPYLPKHHSEGKCWTYNIHLSEHFDNRPAYSSDWVDTPNKFRHLELGNQMYHMEQLTVSRFLCMLEDALERSLEKYLRKTIPNILSHSNVGKMYEVQINGRRYVSRVVHNRFGVPILEKHIWADEDYTILEV